MSSPRLDHDGVLRHLLKRLQAANGGTIEEARQASPRQPWRDPDRRAGDPTKSRSHRLSGLGPCAAITAPSSYRRSTVRPSEVIVPTSECKADVGCER